jgi:hypothetical protein
MKQYLPLIVLCAVAFLMYGVWGRPTSLPAGAQPVPTQILSGAFTVVKMYPSLFPRELIQVAAHPDLFHGYTLPDHLGDASVWFIKLAKRDGNTVNPPRYFHPVSVDVTTVSGNALLYLDSGDLQTGDEVQVGLLVNGGKTILWDVTEKDAANLLKINIPSNVPTLTPNYVSDQELNNVKKTPVFHLGIKADLKKLTPNPIGGGTLSLVTDDLLSTQSQDKATKVDVHLAWIRSISSRIYLPVNIALGGTSNQAFTKKDALASIGIERTPYYPNQPWKTLVDNPVYFMEYPPSLNAEMQWPFASSVKPSDNPAYANPKSLRVLGKITTGPMYLLPAIVKPSKKIPFITATYNHWAFLDAEGTSGVAAKSKADQYDLALYIPPSLLGLQPSPTKPDAGGAATPAGTPWVSETKQITYGKLSYSRGANPANAFKDNKTISYGLEVRY